jgi:hypothetical protein
MNDKYLSEGFKEDLPTQPMVKTTASRFVFLPKGILTILIALLACVSSHVSNTFAEEQTMLNTKIARTDQTVQEMGIVKVSEDQHAEQFSKALDLDNFIKAS